MPSKSAKTKRRPRNAVVKKATQAWVVIHCEFMGTSDAPRMDEMVFHVASTRRAAERYIKSRFVSPFSWWQVQNYRVDIDEVDEVNTLFYSHKGRQMKSPPHKFAMHHFLRHCREMGY